ncbi:MAG: AmmeMemoRadiSam system protein B [Vicinamibacterales bacterium]
MRTVRAGWSPPGVRSAIMEGRIRPALYAGSWYPATAQDLARAVDRYLVRGAVPPAADTVALIAPHAGLMYSGPVAGHAYGVVSGRKYEAVVLVGPSHRVAFDGVASHPPGAFDTPFGPIPVDAELTAEIAGRTPLVRELVSVHAREHSLEIQLPFVFRALPDTPIVPLVVGDNRRATVEELASALASALERRRVLLVASSDLSHYHDATTAARLDARITALVSRFDAAGLMSALEEEPGHACGGGPMVAVMLAARMLGARDARVLVRADSGDVSGDKDAVVGYMAAAFGNFEHPGSS